MRTWKLGNLETWETWKLVRKKPPPEGAAALVVSCLAALLLGSVVHGDSSRAPNQDFEVSMLGATIMLTHAESGDHLATAPATGTTRLGCGFALRQLTWH